jgi:hypothetical protein
MPTTRPLSADTLPATASQITMSVHQRSTAPPRNRYSQCSQAPTQPQLRSVKLASRTTSPVRLLT